MNQADKARQFRALHEAPGAFVIGNAWEYWSAWQYSQTGCVPGIDGDVDLNTFNGSRAACLAWFGPPDFLDALNAAAD